MDVTVCLDRGHMGGDASLGGWEGISLENITRVWSLQRSFACFLATGWKTYGVSSHSESVCMFVLTQHSIARRFSCLIVSGAMADVHDVVSK